jgi:hypothetical protein
VLVEDTVAAVVVMLIQALPPVLALAVLFFLNIN